MSPPFSLPCLTHRDGIPGVYVALCCSSASIITVAVIATVHVLQGQEVEPVASHPVTWTEAHHRGVCVCVCVCVRCIYLHAVYIYTCLFRHVVGDNVYIISGEL